MSFLQPWLLVALPIAALPVIIHLIHQRRFQSIDWGAMKFLLEANRMSRGYARIRQWLILALRVLALAARPRHFEPERFQLSEPAFGPNRLQPPAPAPASSPSLQPQPPASSPRHDLRNPERIPKMAATSTNHASGA